MLQAARFQRNSEAGSPLEALSEFAQVDKTTDKLQEILGRCERELLGLLAEVNLGPQK